MSFLGESWFQSFSKMVTWYNPKPATDGKTHPILHFWLVSLGVGSLAIFGNGAHTAALQGSPHPHPAQSWKSLSVSTTSEDGAEVSETIKLLSVPRKLGPDAEESPSDAALQGGGNGSRKASSEKLLLAEVHTYTHLNSPPATSHLEDTENK